MVSVFEREINPQTLTHDKLSWSWWFVFLIKLVIFFVWLQYILLWNSIAHIWKILTNFRTKMLYRGFNGTGETFFIADLQLIHVFLRLPLTSIGHESRSQQDIPNNGGHLCLEGFAAFLPPFLLTGQTLQQGHTSLHLGWEANTQ